VAKPWRRGTELAAGLVTVLLAGLALALIRGNRLARRRVLETEEHRAELAASNAQFEVARAMAAVKTEQLEATLGGMIDGVSLVDAHLCLVEWNAPYPRFAGVPAEILRVGLPMEEILRAQIRSGQFGPVDDPDTEVAYRIAGLRSAGSDVVRRQRPDGHMLELRRSRTADGGFVIIYRDVTEYDQADRAVSTGTAVMDAANQEGSEFAASNADGPQTQADSVLYGDRDEAGPTWPVEDLSAGPEVAPADLPPRAMPRTRVLLGGNIVAGHGVTATLLRRAGHHVDVAPDGPAVLESMRTAAYDLALLDFDRFGIDGITALIRALPEPACATPLIARTRDLSADQVDAVRAAGLDGVLANRDSLIELMGILKDQVWARSATAGQAATTNREHGWQPAPPALSIARINGLRATLPGATLVNAVEDCLVDLERRLPALRRSLNARAPAAIIAHAQVMISMAATYGMTALEARLRAIVNAAREGDLTPLGTSVVADLDSDYEEASRTLRDMLRTETV
jgi:CheY-like chemotaxis protein/PAS domain-containing protein